MILPDRPLQAASYQAVGGDFPLTTSEAGDQITPALGFGPDGKGYVVWVDNTDGSGSGISAQAYSRNGIRTGSSFRINSTTAGDQVQPVVAGLANGSTLVAWLSGQPGVGAVYGRLIGMDGVLGDEIRISDLNKDIRTLSIAASSGGGAVLVWSQLGADASDFGVLACTLGADGLPTGAARQINSYSPGNQRGSAVASLADGGYVAVWISEGQTGGEAVDVVARRLSSNGTPNGSEIIVSRARSLNQSPTVVGLSSGGFVVSWCTLNGLPGSVVGGVAAAQATLNLSQVVDDVSKVVWGVVARTFSASGSASSAETPISNQPLNSQLRPQVAANADALAIVWSGAGLDSSGSGVGAQVLDHSLNPLGDIVVVNERRRGDQDSPTVVADGNGSFLVVWSNWQGLNAGMDLIARRFQKLQSVLAAPPAPIVEAKSAWQIRALWAPVLGLPVARYEVSFDGGEAVGVSEPVAESGDYFPSTSHTVRYRYVLSDGSTSPYSAKATVVTWGKDQNLDGLPDDWQALYFGAAPQVWPLPTNDSDGDGVSNRDEFLAGTDPSDAADALRVTLGQGFGGSMVSWNAKVGGTYRVQASEDLAQWRDVADPVFAAEKLQSVIVPNTDGVRYFRVLRLR